MLKKHSEDLLSLSFDVGVLVFPGARPKAPSRYLHSLRSPAPPPNPLSLHTRPSLPTDPVQNHPLDAVLKKRSSRNYCKRGLRGQFPGNPPGLKIDRLRDKFHLFCMGRYEAQDRRALIQSTTRPCKKFLIIIVISDFSVAISAQEACVAPAQSLQRSSRFLQNFWFLRAFGPCLQTGFACSSGFAGFCLIGPLSFPSLVDLGLARHDDEER